MHQRAIEVVPKNAIERTGGVEQTSTTINDQSLWIVACRRHQRGKVRRLAGVIIVEKGEPLTSCALEAQVAGLRPFQWLARGYDAIRMARFPYMRAQRRVPTPRRIDDDRLDRRIVLFSMDASAWPSSGRSILRTITVTSG